MCEVGAFGLMESFHSHSLAPVSAFFSEKAKRSSVLHYMQCGHCLKLSWFKISHNITPGLLPKFRIRRSYFFCGLSTILIVITLSRIIIKTALYSTTGLSAENQHFLVRFLTYLQTIFIFKICLLFKVLKKCELVSHASHSL